MSINIYIYIDIYIIIIYNFILYINIYLIIIYYIYKSIYNIYIYNI